MCLYRPLWLCLPPFTWSGFDMILLSLLSSMFHVICVQAFCKDVLQQPAEKMPHSLRNKALPRFALRYYWLQAHGHRMKPMMSFAVYSPAKFAAKYGSTEEAIEKWRQDWLHSPEGRLYGGEGEGAGVSGWAPQNLCHSAINRTPEHMSYFFKLPCRPVAQRLGA